MSAHSKKQLPTAAVEVESPIINSPFIEPQAHWRIKTGIPPEKVQGRRKATYLYRVPEHASNGEEIEITIVNTIRQCVRDWREGKYTNAIAYDGVSTITKELLELWRDNDRIQRLFFAQIEAAETIIFLVEASSIYRQNLPEIPKCEPAAQAQEAGVKAFIRYACKMATGSGKTTVMGMLIAWSILNRIAAPRDDRFSDIVLVVCPNVTIRDRLQELNPALGDQSIYRTRQLVPPHRMEDLRRGEVMIANWHRLAKKESNSVGGESAKVVKTGEPVVIRTGDNPNEIKYFELC
jgi:type III restriction enzyme